jgi:hypothetical protein
MFGTVAGKEGRSLGNKGDKKNVFWSPILCKMGRKFFFGFTQTFSPVQSYINPFCLPKIWVSCWRCCLNDDDK